MMRLKNFINEEAASFISVTTGMIWLRRSSKKL